MSATREAAGPDGMATDVHAEAGLLGRGRAAFERGDLDAAERAFQAALAAVSHRGEALLGLGKIALRRGRSCGGGVPIRGFDRCGAGTAGSERGARASP